MQNSERIILDTLIGGHDYLNEKAAFLGTVPASNASTHLGSIVSSLTSHHDVQSDQKMTARTLVHTKAAARRALVHDHLAPISAVARANLPNTPALAVVRNLPAPTVSIGALLTRADDVAKAVAPIAGTFVDAGLPADFLMQLNAARDTVSSMAYNRKASLTRQHGATDGIRTQLMVGRRQLRILDRMVKTALQGADSSLLSEWKARIALPRGKAVIAAQAPAATPAPETSSAASASAAAA